MNSQIKKYVKFYLYIYIIIAIITFVFRNIFVFNLQSIHLQSSSTAKNIIDACFFAVGPAMVGINIFNKYLWKFNFVRRILSITVPYVEGRWEGTLLSTYTQHKKKHKIAIEFNQTLTKISVWYYDENAITHSLVADVVFDEEGGPTKILCIYDNNPIVNKDVRLSRHIGVMELFVLADDNKIQGTYFNNPVQKDTYGEIDIAFVSRKRLKVFKLN